MTGGTILTSATTDTLNVTTSLTIGNTTTYADESITQGAGEAFAIKQGTANLLDFDTSGALTLASASSQTFTLKQGSTNIFAIDSNGNLALTPASQLDLTGNLAVSGTATLGSTTASSLVITGNTTLGDATSDELSITSRLVSSLLPKLDANIDLGSNSLRFNNIYALTINTAGTNTSSQATFTLDPVDTSITNASVLINPTTADANEALLGIAVAGSERFRVDAEGDISFIGSATIGNASTDSLTLNAGTITSASPTTWNLANGTTLVWKDGSNTLLTLTDAGTIGNLAITGDLDVTGSITNAAWTGDTIITDYGGTGLSSFAAGDILYYSSGTAFTKLAIGSANYVLTSTGSAPQWSNNLTLGTATLDTLIITGSSTLGDASTDSTTIRGTLALTDATTLDDALIFGTDARLYRSTTNTLRTPDTLIIDANLSVGTTTTDTKLQVLATTEQLRLNYDVSNYTSFTINSSGDLIIAPSGGDTTITGTLTTSSTLTTQGALLVEGNTTLGNASTDSLTLNAGTITSASAQTWNIANGLTLTWKDGTNTLMTLADSGTYGTLTVNTLTPSTINAFTLGGAITGNNQNITGVGTFTASTINGLTLTSAADGFTIAGGTTPRTLTVTGSNVSINQNLQTTDSPTFAGLTLTTPLALTSGGTNANLTAVNGGIVYSTASALAVSSAGISGQALVSGGAGSPTWFAPTAGSVLFAGTNGVLSQDNSNLFWDNSNKRLGIGTAEPAVKLDVRGPIRSDIGIVGASGGSSFGYNTYYYAGWKNLDAANTGMFFRADESRMELYSATSGAVPTVTAKGGWSSNGDVFYNLGSVGIGTTSPDYKLEVENGYLSLTNAESGAGTLRLGGAWGHPAVWQMNSAGTKDLLIGNQYANNIRFYYDASNEAMRISNTGNVGIGTTTPGGGN